MSNPIVQLEPWEYVLAHYIGIQRFAANWDTPDAPHYNRAAMEPDRTAQPAAVLCEIAVAKYLNKYFHGGVWPAQQHFRYRSVVDVGQRIEVRRVRKDNGVAVRRTDAGRIVWGARLVDEEHTEVELLGYITADDFIKTLPKEDRWGYADFDELTKPWVSQPDRKVEGVSQ